MSNFDCGILLVSRTITKDYGWLISNVLLNKSERDSVRYIFDAYSNILNTIEKNSVKPVLGIKFENTMAIMCLGISDVIDAQARPIRYLQGYCSMNKNGFSAAEVKTLLQNLQSGELVWDRASVGGFNKLSSEPNLPIVVEDSFECNETSIDNSEPVKQTKIEQFNDRAYDELVNNLGRYRSFAFGVTPEIAVDYERFGDFDFIAQIGASSIEVGKVSIVITKKQGISRFILGTFQCLIELRHNNSVILSQEYELKDKSKKYNDGEYNDNSSIEALVNYSTEIRESYGKFADTATRNLKWYRSADYSIMKKVFHL